MVAGIRTTRLRWMGLILRMKPRKNDEERMIKKVVRFVFKHRQEGDILMDAPKTETWEELERLSEDKKA